MDDVNNETTYNEEQLTEDNTETATEEGSKNWLDNTDDIAGWSAMDMPAVSDVLKRYQVFQHRHTQRLAQYAQLSDTRSEPLHDQLVFFNGWEDLDATAEGGLSLLWGHEEPLSTSGFFFRWNGKGVLVNPGPNFVRQFHKNGFFIQDLDIVINTKWQPNLQGVIRQIYELNYQYNQIADRLHVIHYYLDPSTHRDLSAVMEPRYKQEKGSLHSLEWYQDSNELETLVIDPSIDLSYFATDSTAKNLTLGIVLELKPTIDFESGTDSYSDENKNIRIGYLSGANWNSTMATPFANAQVIITGIGETSEADLTGEQSKKGAMGFLGTREMIGQCRPTLSVVGEFRASDGDLRLEVVKRLREEAQNMSADLGTTAVVLPSDNGLRVDLRALRVRCSVTESWVPAEFVHVAKVSDTFGNLRYLSSDCLL